jgi:hypothetical protein
MARKERWEREVLAGIERQEHRRDRARELQNWLRFGRRRLRWQDDPERVARRAVFRLATRAMPTAMREMFWRLRDVRGFGVRPRWASGWFPLSWLDQAA